METSLVQTIKLGIVSATGLSKDALHIYVGLSIFFGLIVLFKRSKPLAWLLVLIFAILGELLDLRDDIASFGFWRWGASLHDIVNTIFWPTVILLIARYYNNPSARQK